MYSNILIGRQQDMRYLAVQGNRLCWVCCSFLFGFWGGGFSSLQCTWPPIPPPPPPPHPYIISITVILIVTVMHTFLSCLHSHWGTELTSSLLGTNCKWKTMWLAPHALHFAVEVFNFVHAFMPGMYMYMNAYMCVCVCVFPYNTLCKFFW